MFLYDLPLLYLSYRMAYRDTFYKDYFRQQAKRNTLSSSLNEKLAWDQKVYTDEFLHLLPANYAASIVDLGSGYGSLCHWLQHKGFQNIRAIDTSPEQVQRAKELGIPVELCDVHSALDQEERYDVIFAIDFIEHFDKEELVELLKKMFSRLNPNGKLILRSPNIDAPIGSFYAFGDFTHGVVLNKHSAIQLLLACGAHKVDIHPSSLRVKGPVKNTFRKLLWIVVKATMKVALFATGRRTSAVSYTPNLIIEAYKKD